MEVIAMERRVLSIVLALALVLAGAQWLAGEALANGWHFGMSATSEEKLSLGFGYGMVIKEDGGLWAWGAGILGDGEERYFWTGEPSHVPVKVMDSVASVVALRERTFAITTDGSLYAWGSGILGDGVLRDWQNPVLSPVRIMDSVVSVTAYETSETIGNYTTFVIRTDGSLWAWGSGQLGDGVARYMFSGNPALSPVKIMESVASVYTDSDRVFAIQTDGSLWAWGSTSFGLLGCGTVGSWDDHRAAPVRIMDSVASVCIGWDSTMVIRTDGSLWAWGLGQLGDGVDRDSGNPQTTPIWIMDDVVSVSGKRALRADGSLWAWGNNWGGWLGDGTEEVRLSPVRIMDSVATVINSVDSYTMVIRTDGSLWAWGSNFGGQLGDGTASGFDYGDGNIVFYEDYAALEDGEYIYVDNDRRTPVMIIDSVVSVSTFGHYFPGSTIVERTDGSMWAWGSNYNGQLGDGTTERHIYPVEIFAGMDWGIADTEPDPPPTTEPKESPEPPEESPEPPEPPEESPEPPRTPRPTDRPSTQERRSPVLRWVLPLLGFSVVGSGVMAVVLLIVRSRRS